MSEVLQVKFSRSLDKKYNLTLGEVYDVVGVEEIPQRNLLGVDLPLSMSFKVINDIGEVSTLRMCNVEVLVGGEKL